MSDRIIDCPAKVIVIGAEGGCAEPVAHMAAIKTNRLMFNMLLINILGFDVQQLQA
jgi:hypothetical protein